MMLQMERMVGGRELKLLLRCWRSEYLYKHVVDHERRFIFWKAAAPYTTGLVEEHHGWVGPLCRVINKAVHSV